MLRALSAVANDEYLNQIKAYLVSIGGLSNIQAIADGEYKFPNSERRTSQISIRSSIWTLYTAFVIFIYTLTSCLLGMARSGKTDGNITVRLLTNLLVAALSWYLLGYAFSFGRSLDSRLRNRFIGNYTYALHRIREENHNTTSFGYAWFLQSFCYALVCNAIVSEALGLKATAVAHVASTFYTIAFLYPVIAHWLWSTDGWLSAIRPETKLPVGTIGAIDFAGSGVIHLLGASIGLGASLLLRKTDAPKAASENSTLLTVASFLRIFVMYAFVTGCSISIGLGSGDAILIGPELAKALKVPENSRIPGDSNAATMFVAVGRAAVCLTMSIAASALTVLGLESVLCKEYNMTHAMNGLTIGFASICSNVLTSEPWAALLCGTVAGLVYVGGRRGLRSLRDNDVFTIHGLGGMWGLLYTGVLAKPKFIRDVIGYTFYPSRIAITAVKGDDFTGKVLGLAPWTRHGGVFYPTGRNGKTGHVNGKLLACMILELVVVFLWGFVMALPLFFVLKAVKKLSVPAKTDA